MGFAGAALKTLAASDVHFGGDEIAFLDAGDLIAERDHFAAEFVPGNQRRMNASLGPAVPFIDMEIGAADGGDFDLDEHFAAAESGNLNFADLRARRGFRLDHREHGSRHAPGRSAGHESHLMYAESEEQTGYFSTRI